MNKLLQIVVMGSSICVAYSMDSVEQAITEIAQEQVQESDASKEYTFDEFTEYLPSHVQSVFKDTYANNIRHMLINVPQYRLVHDQGSIQFIDRKESDWLRPHIIECSSRNGRYIVDWNLDDGTTVWQEKYPSWGDRLVRLEQQNKRFKAYENDIISKPDEYASEMGAAWSLLQLNLACANNANEYKRVNEQSLYTKNKKNEIYATAEHGIDYKLNSNSNGYITITSKNNVKEKLYACKGPVQSVYANNQNICTVGCNDAVVKVWNMRALHDSFTPEQFTLFAKIVGIVKNEIPDSAQEEAYASYVLQRKDILKESARLLNADKRKSCYHAQITNLFYPEKSIRQSSNAFCFDPCAKNDASCSVM